MRIYLLILLCLASLSVFAQEIEGRLTDENAEALPFATVEVLDADSQSVKYATSRDDGSFSIRGLQAQTYIVKISTVGYNSITRTVDLSEGSKQLGDLKMEARSTELGEVTVSAERALITVEPDKTVFNVSSSVNTAGDNGIELLRKAPGLQVDNDDNIMIEGKSGALVYINGKQSFLKGDDLNNYLRSLNADDIESVEIITQPSSKYDAAGSAGILNIILKRGKGLGLKGSVANTFTYGDYARNNTSVSLNYRQKRFAVFGLYSHYQGRTSGFYDTYRVQSGNVFDGTSLSIYESNDNQGNATLDYYLSPKSTLSAALNMSLNRANAESNSTTLISEAGSSVVDSVLLAPNRQSKAVQNMAASLNYSYDGKNGRTLSVDADWVEYDRITETYQPNIYTSPNEAVSLSENNNFQEAPINIRVLSSQVDYEQKLGGGSFSTGIKASQVETENAFDFYNVENGENILDSNRSNTFNYSEVIGAAYMNYAFQKNKWKFQGGLRAEQTTSKGDLKSNVQTDNKLVKRDYLNWFPSAGVTYTVNPNNTLALLYSRRIQRPNYSNLNPFESQNNELSIRRGNPFLQPKLTHNIKLSNTYKYTLNTSFSYSYVSDFFAEVTEAEGERVSLTNTRNVADQQSYYFSVSYPKQIKKWWNVYATTYGYHTKFTANDTDFVPIERFIYGFYAQSTFTLLKNYKAEVSGWFTSPSIWRGTYEAESIGSLNLAAQRSWDHWTVKLSLNDIFYTAQWRSETNFGDLNIKSIGGRDSRNARLYLSYNFGHSDVKNGKDRKGSAEDERGRI